MQGGRAIKIYLDAQSIQAAEKIGAGNISEGVRNALVTGKTNHRKISMKTLTIANQKGGVGKTAIASQFTFYLADALGLRVLAIDLDHQANFTKVIEGSKLATISKINSGNILETTIEKIESMPFVLIPARTNLSELAADKAKNNVIANNLNSFLRSQRDNFDLAVIDTNPNPDVRMLASLAVSDYALSPVQLNQEAIDGIGSIYSIIGQIQQEINPNLKMLGLLPNLIEPTKFHKENLTALITQIKQRLIPMGDSCAAIKNRTAIAEAQSAGKPVWTLGKTSSREAWTEMRLAFDAIIKLMDMEPKNA
jgi:chromosome partitioning protein